MFDKLCKAAGLPEPIAEYQFAPPRKWRFDWAFIDEEIKIAIEIEGGSWSGGRHTRGKGFANDLIKYRAAVMFGWRLLRYTTAEFADGLALGDVKELIGK